MLEELAEADARDDIASIYTQIRELTRLPYVSSLQRHLATRPGWLPWAWQAVGPLFQCGLAQARAWDIAQELQFDRLHPLSASECHALGLGDDDTRAIRQLADSFIRVSPTNLVFSAIVLRLLDGQQPGEGNPQTPPAFSMPAKIQSLPSLVDVSTLSQSERNVLTRFATVVNDKPFIPGLYRMLAHWPAYLEHLAPRITPLFTDDATIRVCHGLAEAIDAAVPELFAMVKTPSLAKPADFDSEGDAVRAAIMRYRETSPQMVVFGTLIRDMLPAQSVTNE